MQYLTGYVDDTLANARTQIRMTARGVFDDIATEIGLAALNAYTIDSNILDDQASLLIPRAIAYSAGIIDYFFRGQLEISLPDQQVFSVIDQTQHQCPNVCGFSVVKLKLKNSTSVGESMSGGLVVAVAKFHLNTCYQPDLSGDPGGPRFAPTGCRDAEEHIAVSDPQSLTALTAGSERALAFAFSQQIPINATDIYLQVVFRGQLGNEADAVVVGTKNIAEPNYISVSNNYDYKYDSFTDTFQPATPTPPYQNITNIDVKLGSSTTPIASLSQMGPRKYAQLAFLTDLGTAGTEKVVIDYSAAGVGSPLTYASFPLATFDSPGGTVYQRSRNVYQYRGMWRDFDLPFFQGSIQYTTYLCTPQDTRRICSSAGVAPVTAADAVPWTINF